MSPPAPLHLTLEFARPREPADPFAFATGRQTYLLREAEGTYTELVFDWDDQLREDLLGVSIGAAPALQRVGERMRAALTGAGFARVEASLHASTPPPLRLTIRSTAAELYALPWAALALRPSGRLLGQLPDARVRLCWPGVEPAPERFPGSPRLIFAWSEAGGPVPSTASSEALVRVRRASGLGADTVEELPRASLAALVDALAAAEAEGRPFAALHLLCHGTSGPEGPALRLDGGPADVAALRGALAPFARSLRLVVLCACRAADPGVATGPLGSLALGLHRVGVEAVLAPRHLLGLDRSLLLTERLHDALLSRALSLEDALASVSRDLRRQGWVGDQVGLQLLASPREEDLRPVTLRPYRGLLAFKPGERSFFFGREAALDALEERVMDAAAGRRPGFQVLCGASGSGKSSLVQAGLLAALHADRWEVLERRPALDPLAELPPLPDGRRRLIVVDPFQELFTQVPTLSERRRVAAGLWAAAKTPGTVVLAVMRSDALGQGDDLALDAEGTRLDRVLYDEAHRIFLPAPGPEELRAAIEGPAARVGLRLEPGLCEAVLDEAGQQPGALPLVQHALDRLWERREGRLLTHAAWRSLGGLSGALARSADATMEAMREDELQQARALLVNLVAEGAGAARRVVPLAELRPATQDGAAFDRALDRLVVARLVVLGAAGGRPTAELAHEALIRGWGRLSGWLEEDAERRAQRAELTRWATDWDGHRGGPDQGASYLLEGARLGYALEVAARQGGALPDVVIALLEASREAEERERATRQAELLERERLARRALHEAARARDAALLASATALRASDPTLALLLLREARPVAQPLAWTREALSLLRGPICVRSWALGASPARLRGALHPRGDRVATPTQGGVSVQALWGNPSHALNISIDDSISDLCWSPDGHTLAVGVAGGGTWLWSDRGEPGPRLVAPPGSAEVVRFSPDGQQVLVGGRDGMLRRWRTDGVLLAKQARHVLAIREIAIDQRRGRLLTASADRAVLSSDLDGQRTQTLSGHQDEVIALAVREDRLLSASQDGGVKVWDLADAGRPRQLGAVDTGLRLRAACWGLERDLILVGGEDGDLHRFRLDGTPLGALADHRGPVSSIETTDKRVLTLAADGRLHQWWSRSPYVPRELQLGTSRLSAAHFEPSGRAVAAGDAEGAILLFGLSEDLPTRRLDGHTREVHGLRFDPRGALLASAGEDATALLWSISAPEPKRTLRGHEGAVIDLAWSPDGERLATGSADGTARIWTRDGAELACLDHDGAVRFTRWCPRGQALATLTVNGRLHVWTREGAPIGRIGGKGVRDEAAQLRRVRAAAWRPVGDGLAISVEGGLLLLWDPERGALEPLGEQAAGARALAWLGGDGALATGDQAGVVRRWSAGLPPRELARLGTAVVALYPSPTSGRMIAQEETGRCTLLSEQGEDGVDLGMADGVAWSADGAWAALGGRDGQLRLWPLDGATLREQLALATRVTLEPEERARYLGELGGESAGDPTP